MVCINSHTDSTNLSIKNKDLARSAPQHSTSSSPSADCTDGTTSKSGREKGKTEQYANNVKGGCSSPFTRSQIKALESLGLIAYNDELLCVDINKASQLSDLM